jgi:hypothetical protein
MDVGGCDHKGAAQGNIVGMKNLFYILTVAVVIRLYISKLAEPYTQRLEALCLKGILNKQKQEQKQSKICLTLKE